MKNKSKIRNIIFDLGGVLIDLDISQTVNAFNELSIPAPATLEETERRALMYAGLETGKISAEIFRQAIRDLSPREISDAAIDKAWNAMLSDFPEGRVEVLQQLKENYRVFLLSNSNAIHYQYYAKRFKRKYAIEMNSLFEQAYYSFEMKICKPSPEIFREVLQLSNLLPEETLFIDDTLDNINSAASLGIQGHHLQPGQDMGDLFRNGVLIKDSTLVRL